MKTKYTKASEIIDDLRQQVAALKRENLQMGLELESSRKYWLAEVGRLNDVIARAKDTLRKDAVTRAALDVLEEA